MLQQPSYTQKDLDALFNVEHPPLMQLPQGQMRMIDRVVYVSSTGGKYNKGELIAEFDINPDLWFFKCHFPGDPIMPGCLGLDALWQGLGFYLAWAGYEGKGRALGMGSTRFFGEVLPDASVVRYHIHIRKIFRKDMVLGIADGEVFVDGEQIYSAENIRTGLIPVPGMPTLS